MNKIQETIERGVEELKTAHAEMFTGRVSALYVDKLFKSHQKALLEAVLEEVRGRVDHKLFGFSVIVSDNPDVSNEGKKMYLDGYNQALQDIETIINKAIGV